MECRTWQGIDCTKAALANAVTLAYPDSNRKLCLFTDASDKHWSGILTQIPERDLDLPFVEQHHEPLAFQSGSFAGFSYRWSTPEKEASAIIKSCERLDYLLLRPEGFHLYTDHSNLVFLYHPERANIRMNKTIYNKILRWGPILSMFQYTIIHIKGEDNCWADLLSRWGSEKSEPTTAQVEHLRVAALFHAPVAPQHDPDFSWPSLAENTATQRSADEEQRENQTLHEEDGLYKTDKDQVWIPSDAEHLQLRICVIGHCGIAGHRGYKAIAAAIETFAYWKNMDQDMQYFCNSCLHCRSTIGGKRV